MHLALQNFIGTSTKAVNKWEKSIYFSFNDFTHIHYDM